ncbi:hypothetical protein [Novipirellula artificiosorum]|uniref:Secreted protein n=1 Tax=Novipirellula artificiosorum TaxID=2528016 RepID=A0A5C6DJ02_9BACT|nr:hypothetical protein [Novipirellula artificiosorum]TWU36215.1 hypothetical protein Poly41_39700 [Novipirellula artificiosorum]
MSTKLFHAVLGAACLCCFVAVMVGCSSSNEPTAPEAGVLEGYLDENPEIAARVNEGDEGTDSYETDE